MEKKYEDKPNYGVLHQAKVKKNPNEPDYFGEIRVDLSTVDIANNVATVKIGGWKKTSKAGKTYLSLRVSTWKGNKPQAQEIEDDDPF